MKYLFIIVIFLYSCTTQKKAINYFNNNEEVAANYCANKYPIGTDTMVIVEHDTTILKEYIKEIDSLEIHDTICLELKEKIKYIIKNNPPVVKTITIEKENTAKLKALQIKIESKDKLIDDLNAERKKYKSQSKSRLAIILWLLLILVGFIAAKFLPIR